MYYDPVRIIFKGKEWKAKSLVAFTSLVKRWLENKEFQGTKQYLEDEIIQQVVTI